jgi:hypothetical protein
MNSGVWKRLKCNILWWYLFDLILQTLRTVLSKQEELHNVLEQMKEYTWVVSTSAFILEDSYVRLSTCINLHLSWQEGENCCFIGGLPKAQPRVWLICRRDCIVDLLEQMKEFERGGKASIIMCVHILLLWFWILTMNFQSLSWEEGCTSIVMGIITLRLNLGCDWMAEEAAMVVRVCYLVQSNQSMFILSCSFLFLPNWQWC